MEKEMKQSKFKRICVFCGSSPGKKSSYKEATIELGEELVSKNIDLVYGGGSVGLMGLISQAVYDGGRHVIGVIPKTLMPREIEAAWKYDWSSSFSAFTCGIGFEFIPKSTWPILGLQQFCPSLLA